MVLAELEDNPNDYSTDGGDRKLMTEVIAKYKPVRVDRSTQKSTPHTETSLRKVVSNACWRRGISDGGDQAKPRNVQDLCKHGRKILSKSYLEMIEQTAKQGGDHSAVGSPSGSEGVPPLVGSDTSELSAVSSQEMPDTATVNEILKGLKTYRKRSDSFAIPRGPQTRNDPRNIATAQGKTIKAQNHTHERVLIAFQSKRISLMTKPRR